MQAEQDKEQSPDSGRRSPPPVLLLLGGLISAVVVVILFTPNYSNGTSQEDRDANTCVDNLRQINGAKRQWAIEHNMPDDARPAFPDLVPYLGRAASQAMNMRCPAANPTDTFLSSYVIGVVTNYPRCRFAHDHPYHVLQ